MAVCRGADHRLVAVPTSDRLGAGDRLEGRATVADGYRATEADWHRANEAAERQVSVG